MLAVDDDQSVENEFVVEEIDGTALADHHRFFEEEPENPNDFGGMELAVYDAIIDFKKFGRYPAINPDIDSRVERSANCHWRLKCSRFLVSPDDNETLLYYNQNSPSEEPKVVVKKGEVRRVVERVHELIGHLGMKRTQYTIMRKLYWRSVRNDVRNFVNSCEFCINKKVEGKKIMKAPIDIMSEDFDLQIEIRSVVDVAENGGERLLFSLKGIDEEEVRLAAVQRMTTYTFKETATERPPRLASTTFRRQPYVKRSRFSNNTGFLVPFNGPGEYSKKETNFIEVYQSDIVGLAGPEYDESVVVEEALVQPHLIDGVEEVIEEVVDINDGTFMTADETSWDTGAHLTHAMPSTSQEKVTRMERVATTSHTLITIPNDTVTANALGLHPTDEFVLEPHLKSSRLPSSAKSKYGSSHMVGMGNRFAGAMIAPDKLLYDAGHLVNSYEEAQRPELCPLAPIMFLPSADPDVVMLQKELLERQRKIQLMQHELLERQLEHMHRMQTRYDEHDVVEEAVDQQ